MAPNLNNANQHVASSITNNEHNVEIPLPTRQKPLTDNGLQRTVSDKSFELNNREAREEEPTLPQQLPPISEVVENAKCECCGMCEECTKEYIKSVREMFLGRLLCGLCAAAVNEEMEKNGGKREEAVEEHVRACVRFNRLGRSYPALYQAEAIKEILKKSSRSKSIMSTCPRDRKSKDGIARSSSCIPSITREKVGGAMNHAVSS